MAVHNGVAKVPVAPVIGLTRADAAATCLEPEHIGRPIAAGGVHLLKIAFGIAVSLALHVAAPSPAINALALCIPIGGANRPRVANGKECPLLLGHVHVVGQQEQGLALPVQPKVLVKPGLVDRTPQLGKFRVIRTAKKDDLGNGIALLANLFPNL